jgi:hypothetical protein
MKWAAIVLCSFRHKSPAGPVVNSDDEHDDRDQHDHDNLPDLVDIIQPDWLPLPITPPPRPPPQPQPTQSVTMDKVFANFCSVLNLQLIPEDERNTDVERRQQQQQRQQLALLREILWIL